MTASHTNVTQCHDPLRPPHLVSRVRFALISSLGVMLLTPTSRNTAKLAARASWILSGYDVTNTLNQPVLSRSYVVT
jgi:hypothetical protein